ncbi:NUDIX domain-containing protein [Candidatus Woesearchaeota archaeon]|nr:NUDIX domain-containing protein [Candidatus Woesearchaeota archaeon]
MAEELIEEIDEKGNTIAVHPRSELKKRMFRHKAALIIPTQGEKLVLCRRAKDKHPFPDTWCCAVGGKVIAGETFEQAAQREMQEEIGTTAVLSHVVTFNYNGQEYPSRFAVFTTTLPKQLALDPTEIQYLKAFTAEEINKMIIQNPNEFAPTFRAALQEFLNATIKSNTQTH